MKYLLILLAIIGMSGCKAQSTTMIDHSNALLIRHVNYIDVDQGFEIRDQDILIIDGVIARIKSNLNGESNGMTIINGRDKWLVPGLIDAHIHLFQSGGLYTRPDAIDLTDIRPYGEEIEWLKINASSILQSYLRLGITTVIDVGGPMYNYQIREEYKGSNNHPNIYLTGPLISTYQPEAFQIDDPPIIKVSSIVEARKLVQMQLPYQPDFIKIWYITLPTLPASNAYEIVAAAIDESHKNNLKVAVHATQLNTAKLALKAGADILVHSVANPVDDDFIKMLNDNNVTYIPTLAVHGNYDLAFANTLNLDDLDLAVVSPEVIGSLLDVRHLNHPNMEQAKSHAGPMLSRTHTQDKIRKANLKKLIASDVTIATGTDAGNIGTLHASSYFNELGLMSEAGLSNAEILKASTIGAAHTVDQQDNLGSVVVGKKADLLLLNANPLEDLSALGDINLVIKSGSIVDKSIFRSNTPEELTQRQLNAYNLHNIEAFLEPYSDSVRVYSFPDQLLYIGKEKMRTTYTAFFERTPDLHCELINRMVLGNTIIDQEHVTGLNDGSEIRAVAIYKIKNGKIQEVYFDSGE